MAQIRPPWAATLARLMANPLPMPLALVVQKALNMYFRVTSSLPIPVSWNDMVIVVELWIIEERKIPSITFLCLC